MENDAFNRDATGLILDVTHGSTKDGPGWRSVVYFKGCNARCPWCSAPESMSAKREPLLFPEREKYPERAVCAHGAVRVEENRTLTNREVCETCETFECADHCLDGSREVAGRIARAGDLVDEIVPYKLFHSEYGVTLTGGEATCQWDFFVALLKGCRAGGLHSAVETNGLNPRLPEAFPLLDLVICDLKMMDPGRHTEIVGGPLENVLDNIRNAAEHANALWVRLPVVPGFNGESDLRAAAELLSMWKDRLSVELLGYHNLGAYRWTALGRKYACADVAPPTEAKMESLRDIFRGKGLRVIAT